MLMLSRREEFEIIGVITVAGKQTLERLTDNIRNRFVFYGGAA